MQQHRYIDGVPVNESPFGIDPFEPVRCAEVTKLIHLQTDMPAQNLRPGETASDKTGILVYDAATAADLEAAGRQLFQNGTPPVLAGCAGFAAFLPELLGLSDGSVVEVPQLDPRLLVLCGSVNPITLRQMDTAEKAGFTRLRLTPRQKLEPGYWASADGKAALAEIEAMLAANPRCIIETNDAGGNQLTADYAAARGIDLDGLRVGISGSVGQMFGALFGSEHLGTLLLTGGDTKGGSFMASAAVQNKTPRKVLKKSTRDSLIAYSFIAPNFIGFCVFTLVPMVFAIALAFCAWDGRHAIEFIGLKNFVKLFTTDKIFQAALKNTVVYVIGTVPLTLACSLAMAVLLNQNVKLRNFFRTVAFFPYVASLVAVAAVWNMIFNPSMGPINMILNQFFGVAVENLPRWAAGKDTAMITVILFSVWKNMGRCYMITQGGRQHFYHDAGSITSIMWPASIPISEIRLRKPAISMVLFVLVLIVTIIQFRGSKTGARTVKGGRTMSSCSSYQPSSQPRSASAAWPGLSKFLISDFFPIIRSSQLVCCALFVDAVLLLYPE